MEIIIECSPVPWSAHKGFGRRAFNPKFQEKEFYQWKIKQQYEKNQPIETAVKLDIVYHMHIPTSCSKTKLRAIASGHLHHIKRPDLDNLNKFLCDCLKTLVFVDDSQVCKINCCKEYSETPKTVIRVTPLE